MNLSQSILEALESLSSNKMRSGLTVLGIVIGVAAVIAMLAVGTGAQDSITGSISGIGSRPIPSRASSGLPSCTQVAITTYPSIRAPIGTRRTLGVGSSSSPRPGRRA